MKEALIINLTRMGDLIQTTPVIVGLKEKYPGIKISLLVNSAFRSICELIPYVDHVIEFDLRGVADLIINNHLIKAYKYINQLLEIINSTTYDMAINFTHSTDSAVLLSLINSKDHRGINIDKEGYSIKKHPWAQYVFNVIPSRVYNPFHLCDMHCKIASVLPTKKGLHLKIDNRSEEYIQNLLNKYGVHNNCLIVALQLGASTDEKRWPVESFARVAELLGKRFKVFFVLTGTKNELQYGNLFQKLTNVNTINLIGKTSLKELTALLKYCNILISNDTGPLHIATALGTTVINLSMASVHFRETGPYGEGHYVVVPEVSCYPCMFNTTCSSFICRDKISPEVVYKVAYSILKNGYFHGHSLQSSHEWKDVQVYKSFFSDDGLIEYEPLIKGRPIKKEELFTYLYRQTWQLVLDEKKIPEGDFLLNRLTKLYKWYDRRSIQTCFTGRDIKDLERVAEISKTIVNILKPMERISINETHLSMIHTLWENILPLDRELEKVSHVNNSIRPISILLKYEKESFQDQHVSLAIKDAIKAYNRVFIHACLLKDLLIKLKTPSFTEVT